MFLDQIKSVVLPQRFIFKQQNLNQINDVIILKFNLMSSMLIIDIIPQIY